MSKPTDLSKLRSALIDMTSDLRGIELNLLATPAADDVACAQGHLQSALRMLTSAMTHSADVATAVPSGVLCH